jgi:hypothetical protein
MPISDTSSRRAFLVTLNGALLGSFIVPDSPAWKSAADLIKRLANSLSRHRPLEQCDLPRAILHIIGQPELAPDESFLLYVAAARKKGETTAEPMMWMPTTDQERSEMMRLYEACTKPYWGTIEKLQEQVRQPGSWVVRWRLGGQCVYFADFDPRIGEVDGEIDDDSSQVVTDPADAIAMTHGEAINWAVRLTRQSPDSIFEPVELDSAKQMYELYADVALNLDENATDEEGQD